MARVADFGANDTVLSTVTHLGHVLRPGDRALGYDLEHANVTDDALEAWLQRPGAALPDVILVRPPASECIKSFPLHGWHWTQPTMWSMLLPDLSKLSLAEPPVCILTLLGTLALPRRMSSRRLLIWGAGRVGEPIGQAHKSMLYRTVSTAVTACCTGTACNRTLRDVYLNVPTRRVRSAGQEELRAAPRAAAGAGPAAAVAAAAHGHGGGRRSRGRQQSRTQGGRGGGGRQGTIRAGAARPLYLDIWHLIGF